MKAHELADIVEKKFGEVTFAAIDLDTDVNYPKGERWIYVHTSLLLAEVMHASFYCFFFSRCWKGLLYINQQLHGCSSHSLLSDDLW